MIVRSKTHDQGAAAEAPSSSEHERDLGGDLGKSNLCEREFNRTLSGKNP